MSSVPVTPGTDARAEYEEYLAATQGMAFVKDFLPALSALMMDPTIGYGQRFMAWLKLRSWGNYRLYAVTDDGEPATQADCTRELGIDKRRLTHVVAFYEQRGYLYRKGKRLYPSLTPQATPPPEKSLTPRTFLQFVEDWKVAHSSDFLALEVARSEVKRLEKVRLSAYKEWRTSRTNGGPTLYIDKEDLKTDNPPPPQPSVSVAEPDQPKAEEEDALYQKFKEAYPKDHFDEPKAKAAFKKLSPPERHCAVARLLFPFLSCPRWLDEGGRWIPLASNFLKDYYYEAEPPPAFKTAKAGKKLASFEDVAQFMGKPEWET